MNDGRKKKKDRQGERNLSSYGVGMEIIAYRNANDIDVRFDDGTIVRNKTYYSFRTGRLKKNGERGKAVADKTGLTGISSDGQIMTITAYRNSTDIDVRFADGSILEHRTWQEFQAGRLKSPLVPNRSQKRDRTGERGMASNGMGMEIICYRGTDDIDVRFDDGTVVMHRTYKSFRSGQTRPDKITCTTKKSLPGWQRHGSAKSGQL